MRPRDRKRAAVLRRFNRYCDVRQLLEDENLTARELADQLLDLEARAREYFCGGAARFTGNNRVFGNGAVAYEVRCRQCRRLFWVTSIPYALCPDCA